MTAQGFKEMCRQLKIFPVVVSQETAEKVTVFCAKKLPNVPDFKSDEPQINVNTDG